MNEIYEFSNINQMFFCAQLGESNNYTHLMNSIITYNQMHFTSVRNAIKICNDINQKNSIGWTALMIACLSARLSNNYSWVSSPSHQIVSLILTSDANVNIQNNDGNTSMIIASCCPNINIIKLLLDNNKIKIDQQNNYGYTALMMSMSSSSNPETTKMLLEKNPNVNIKNDKGDTALSLLFQNFNKQKEYILDKTQLLIKYNADINTQNNDGLTPLMIICSKYSNENKIIKNIIKLLLKYRANINLKNNLGNDALSILFDMQQNNKNDNTLNSTIKLFHKKHPVYEEFNSCEQNKLYYLSEINKTNCKIFHKLIEFANNDDISAFDNAIKHYGINYQNEDGWTLLMFAYIQSVSHPDFQNIDNHNKNNKHLESKQNIYSQNNINYNKVLENILKHCKNINFWLTNNDGDNINMIYTSCGGRSYSDLENKIRYSYNRHSDDINHHIDHQNIYGMTALMMSLNNDYYHSYSRTLLVDDPNINIKNNEGNTAIMIGCKYINKLDCESILSYLLEYVSCLDKYPKNKYSNSWTSYFMLHQKTNMNPQNNNRETALILLLKCTEKIIQPTIYTTHITSIKRVFRIAKQLIETGHDSNVNIQDNEGNTALHCAFLWEENDCIQIIQLLLSHGANSTIKNNDNISPENLISKCNNKLFQTKLKNLFNVYKLPIETMHKYNDFSEKLIIAKIIKNKITTIIKNDYAVKMKKSNDVTQKENIEIMEKYNDIAQKENIETMEKYNDIAQKENIETMEKYNDIAQKENIETIEKSDNVIQKENIEIIEKINNVNQKENINQQIICDDELEIVEFIDDNDEQDAEENFKLLCALEYPQKLIVNDNKLELDNRWFQSVTRYWTGNSRIDLIKPMKFTFDIMMNKKNGQEIINCLNNVMQVATRLYPNFTELTDLLNDYLSKF